MCIPVVCFCNIIVLILKAKENVKVLNTRSLGDQQHVLVKFGWLTVGGGSKVLLLRYQCFQKWKVWNKASYCQYYWHFEPDNPSLWKAALFIRR